MKKRSFNQWLESLKSIIPKASKGQWWIDSHGSSLSVPEKGERLCVFKAETKAVRHEDTGNLSSWRNDNDADYIPTACPTNVNELVLRYEALNAAFLKLSGLSEDGEYDLQLSNGELKISVVEGHVLISGTELPDREDYD